ncbi:hypothetical protein MKW98_011965 [Papaver atlanticum]|uniref:F-box domain-containing protein n=1 Tax=Papaver atlanticum TaxID=357466 RepID=A0AAD4RYC4_9MAGN|nr:hypothetical protein MKW98_011965 [Papaver atlanticum]
MAHEHDPCEKQKVAGIDDDSSETNGNILCQDMIASEILSRLRVKSLMRFKCVCKHWKCLIEQDKHFIDLHLTRSKTQPSLLINVPHNVARNNFLAADLLFEGKTVSAAVHTVVEGAEKFANLFPVSGIVNGLICLLSKGTTNYSKGTIRIWNVSTQEVTPPIESTLQSRLLQEVKGPYRSTCSLVNYAMGFSPATKEHKVIFMWQQVDPSPRYKFNYIYEVLTVGDNKWRRIHEVPQYSIVDYIFSGAAVYVNGVLYFKTNMLMEKTHNSDKFIVAFDVDTEKFRSIRIPLFILNSGHKDYRIELLEVNCCIALVTRNSGHTFKLWLYDKENRGASYLQNWCEAITIKLPDYWGRAHYHKFYSAGTDRIISHYCPGSYNNKVKNGSLHCFNLKNKAQENIQVSGIPKSVANFSSAIGVTTYVESLLRVN